MHWDKERVAKPVHNMAKRMENGTENGMENGEYNVLLVSVCTFRCYFVAHCRSFVIGKTRYVLSSNYKYFSVLIKYIQVHYGFVAYFQVLNGHVGSVVIATVLLLQKH